MAFALPGAETLRAGGGSLRALRQGSVASLIHSSSWARATVALLLQTVLPGIDTGGRAAAQGSHPRACPGL